MAIYIYVVIGHISQKIVKLLVHLIDLLLTLNSSKGKRNIKGKKYVQCTCSEILFWTPQLYFDDLDTGKY